MMESFGIVGHYNLWFEPQRVERIGAKTLLAGAQNG